MNFKYYFPMFRTPPPNKYHSIQLGWGKTNQVPTYQEELGVKYGGDQTSLFPENAMQTVHVTQFYNYWSNLSFSVHALCYDKKTKSFPYPEEATAWIKNNPRKRYIIGNEPDGPYSSGGIDMSESDFADFYHVSSTLIRNADPSAYLIMGAWAGGIAEPTSFSHNESEMLNIYYNRYGKIDADALSWHCYQRNNPTRTYPVDKMNKFADYARLWKSRGWTSTDKIILTEFGWYGLDTVGNTPENCIAFMDYYIPKLRAHSQVVGWHWWPWGEGARLMKSGELTSVGEHYKQIK